MFSFTIYMANISDDFGACRIFRPNTKLLDL